MISNSEVQSLQKVHNSSICFIDNEQPFLDDLAMYLINEEYNMNNILLTRNIDDILIKYINKFDVFVSDYKMPLKNGIFVLEEIRKENKNALLILLTGYVISVNVNEDSRCYKSNIKRLNKSDGFDNLFGNINNFLSTPAKTYDEDLTIENPKKWINLLNRVGSRVSHYRSQYGLETRNKPYEIEQNPWKSKTTIEGKIIKILELSIICECILNRESQTTELRELPKSLFDNITDLNEEKFINIIIYQGSGNMQIEVSENLDSKIKNFFDLSSEWEILKAFNEEE